MLSLLCVSGVLHCKHKASISPELRQRYDLDAARLCNAIVDCLKEDVARRLADQPERRDVTLSRMTRDLCKERQFALIGQVSVAPGPAALRTDQEIYESYGRCSASVAAAADCNERRRLYRQDPDCVRMKLVEAQSP